MEIVVVGVEKYDWTQLRRDYVEGVEIDGEFKYPTAKELAAFREVNELTLRTRITTEKWLPQRKEFLARVEAGRREEEIQRRIDDGLKLDNTCFDISEACMTQLKFILNAQMKHLRNTGETADLKELEGLTKILERIQRVGMVSRGTYMGQTPTTLRVEGTDTALKLNLTTDLTPEERDARVRELLDRRDLYRP